MGCDLNFITTLYNLTTRVESETVFSFCIHNFVFSISLFRRIRGENTGDLEIVVSAC